MVDPAASSMDQAIAALKQRRGKTGSGPREKLESLLDPRSFQEWRTDRAQDSWLGGWGTIEGRGVVVLAEFAGPAPTETGETLACRLARYADRNGIPLIYLLDHGQAPAWEGPLPDAPVLAILLSRPSAEGQRLTQQADLAIAVHGQGAASCEAPSEAAALRLAREALGFLADRGQLPALRPPINPPLRAETELLQVVPESPQPYDMKAVLVRVIDDGQYLELEARQGQSVVTALARIGGRAIGILASQPKLSGGGEAARHKAVGFLRRCRQLALPIVCFEDGPWDPVLRDRVREALAIHAPPRLGLVLRHARPEVPSLLPDRVDLLAAWPTARLGEAPDLRIEPRETRQILLRGLELARAASFRNMGATYLRSSASPERA